MLSKAALELDFFRLVRLAVPVSFFEALLVLLVSGLGGFVARLPAFAALGELVAFGGAVVFFRRPRRGPLSPALQKLRKTHLRTNPVNSNLTQLNLTSIAAGYM